MTKVADYKKKQRNTYIQIVLFFLFLLVFGFFFWQNWGQNLFAKAGIKVESVSGEALVSIDEQEKGQTVFKSNIATGSHMIEVFKRHPFYHRWVQNVDFKMGFTTYINREIGPSSMFSAGEVIYFEEGESGLSLVSSPDEVDVFAGDEKLGTTPLFLPNLTVGDYEISFSKTGYEGRKMTVKVKEDAATYISVDLFKTPVLSEPQILRQTDISDFPILELISREAWKVDENLSSQENNEYAPVSKMDLYDLSSDNDILVNDPKGWIGGIYYYETTYSELTDLDWHFFIDKEGKIYEGKAGGIEVVLPRKEKGIVHVGYLGKVGVGLTQEAEAAYLILEASTESERNYKADILEKQETVLEMKAGELKDLSVVYKNIGQMTWYDSDPRKVYLKVENMQNSFFANDNWIDQEKIKLLATSYVSNDEEIRFEFAVTGPNKNDEHTQKFSLGVERDGVLHTIEGSEFTVTIRITGGVQKSVVIKETGTGYLNMRDSAAFSAGIVDRVTPGETYIYAAEEVSWVKIRLANGVEGWVSKQYVDIVDP